MKKFDFISTVLQAEDSTPTGPQGWQQSIGPMVPLLVMFFIFYFLVIRPQQKKTKLHQKFLNELKKGDMVVTASGLIGTVRSVSEKLVTLEVDEGVCIKILRGQIQDSAQTLKAESAS